MYNTGMWSAFFFIYCFLGWCFESAYVSMCEKRLINRGFLKGPMLPIYGFGASIMLLVTIPYRDDYMKTYIAGAVAATVLEYFTGAAMEKLFKVKYWDYSLKKFNIKGYICLSSTIVWGFFAIFLVNVIHNPIGEAVSALPHAVLYMVDTVIAMIMIWDFAVSFKTAFGMRNLIIKLNEYKEKTRAEIKAALKNFDIAKPEISKFMHGSIRDMLYASENLSKQMMLQKFSHEKYTSLKKKIEEIRVHAAERTEHISKKATKDKLKMLRRNPTRKNKWLAEEFEKLKHAEKNRRKNKL